MRKLLGIATLSAALAAAVPAGAQTLQDVLGGRQDANELRSPYATPRGPAFRLQDHIRVVVVERARASSRSDLRTDRRARTEVDLAQFIKLSRQRGHVFPDLEALTMATPPGIDLDARYRQDNTGRTVREFDLSFTVMARVIDVRPNGNAVIEARRERVINGETEIIRLTGEVSPQFVENNSIKSENILNLQVSYEGEGSVSDQARPGFLARILGKIWPF